MENLVWRFRSKVVAIIDLIFMGLSAILLFVGVIVLLIALSGTSDGGPITAQIGIMLVVGSWNGIVIWAAWYLLNACNMTRSPIEALKMAERWTIVTTIFFVIGILGSLVCLINPVGHIYYLQYIAWSYIIYLVWRGASLFVVSQYITEIKGLNTPKSENV